DITWPLRVDQSAFERPLRSPHNIAVNVFTRTGILGLSLWILVLGTWLWQVLRGMGAARRVSKARGADYLLWMCTYAVTLFVVALFGVVLEGPFAAIPFFLLMGMALKKAQEFEPAVAPVLRRS